MDLELPLPLFRSVGKRESKDPFCAGAGWGGTATGSGGETGISVGEYSSGVETSMSTTPVCSVTRAAGSGGRLRVVGGAAAGAVTMGGAVSRTIGAGGGLSGKRPIGGGRSAPSAGGTNGALRPRITGAAAGAQAPARLPITVVRGRAGRNGGGGCNCSPAMVGSTGGPLTGAATVIDGTG